MPFTQGIALGQNQDGLLELMATVRADSPDLPGGVWHVREARNDPGWPPQWESLGVALDSGFGGPAPAITRNKDERLEVVITSADALLHSWQTEPNGNEWHHDSLDRPAGQVMTRVSSGLAQNKDGHVEAFVLGHSDVEPPHVNEGQLWTIRQDPTAPGGWSPWLELGTPGVRIRHRPAVAPDRDGRLEVFVQGDSLESGHLGTVYHIRQDPTGPDGWSNWAELGSPQVPLLGQPVVARNKDGRLEVFMLGADGAVWHSWQTKPNGDEWTPRQWHSLEGQGGPFSGLAVGAHADGRLVVFAVAEPSHSASPQQANAIWQREHKLTGGWSPWRSFTRPDGSPTVRDPALALDAKKQLQLWLAIEGSGRLYQLKQAAPNGTEWNQREWDLQSPPSKDPADETEPAGGRPV
jgi:hypothetical protein